MFKSIEECMKTKNIKRVMEIAEKLKTFCDARTRRIIPKKDNYFEDLYDMVAKALVDMKRLNYTQCEWDRMKRVYQMLGYKISREPSVDSVVKQFKDIFIDYK